jgi:hypothetical protein
MDKLHEESRKQFEEWFSENYPLKKPSVRKLKLWDTWQASRASVVVDVPEVIGYGMINREELLAIIHSIGLSIKGE